MVKPTNLAEWGTGGGAPITEPLLAEKQAGWPVSFKPPAQWFNWWMKSVHLWLVWLNTFESTAHTWSALQTFSAGILSAAFGATAGIRGTTAINSVPAISGTTTVSANAIFGTSSHASGRGAYFTNTAVSGGGVALEATGRYGGIFTGTEWAGSVSSIDTAATSATAAGALGVSSKLNRPGVRGEGNPSSGAWGGEFIGADSEESSTPGGLGLWFRGGASSITDFAIDAGDGMIGAAGDATGDGSLGQSGSGGTNTLRGGNVDGLLNDEGLPGIGLTLTGGSVTDDSNNRTGATALKLIKGTGTTDGLALEADGDAELDGRLRLMGATEAYNTQQVAQLSPGLMVKAWARVRWNAGAISIDGSAAQNVSAVGFQTAASGRWYVDFALSIPKASRCIVCIGDAGNSTGGKLCHPIEGGAGDAFGRSDTRAVFEVTDAATPSNHNLSTGSGYAFILVMGL